MVNVLLIIVTVVIAVAAVLVALYLLVYYQHPEDRTQAWIPKIVVIFGISLAIWTVLLFPLDVANRKTCSSAFPQSYCTFTIPTTQLWYACYIANAVVVYGFIPFAMFYYEADSDLKLMARVISALLWEAATLVVVALILGIMYGVIGFVQYPIYVLQSGLMTLPASTNSSNLNFCITANQTFTSPQYSGRLCDAISGNIKLQTWTMRTSFPVYVIALSASVGWLLFMVFAGVGLVALPLDCIREFFGRPRSTITKSEYIKRAKGLGQRANSIKELAEKLRKEEREGGRSRKWRANFNRLNAQLVALENDERALELVHPQGEDPDYIWAITVMWFYAKALFGILGAVLSVCWLLQVILYIFIQPPATTFLNAMFLRLDKAFGLFGVAAFALFCFYIILAVIKGCMKVGLNLLIITVHPMKPGATLMSSFLFNTGLMLLATNAAIQFCAQAFALYANETAIQQIWGGQIQYLKGLKYLYRLGIFLYCMVGFIGLTLLFLILRGPLKWKRRTLEDVYAA